MSGSLGLFQKTRNRSSSSLGRHGRFLFSGFTGEASEPPTTTNVVASPSSLLVGPLSSSFPATFLAVATLALISTTFSAVSRNSTRSEPQTSYPLSTTDETTQEEEATTLLENNPLWPQGVSPEDVDELVDDILRDPSINISAVPDYIERQIYRSTIRLTLNAVYQSLSGVHGHEMLGHEFRLQRVSAPKSHHQRELFLLELRSDVQEQMLEDVADRLMANKAINQRLLPDAIERQIYVNCLKIVFRLLDLLTTTFRLTVCGHDLHLEMEPSTRYAIQEAALARASSSLTEIDMQVMTEIARQSGVDMEETDRERWFWQRFFDPCNNQFVASLHASLYGLILGVLDDLLANTELELLSDRIRFDIVPKAATNIANKEKKKASPQTSEPATAITKASAKSLLRALPLVAFSVGVGVGVMIVTWLGTN